jgi:hypothetical protein
LVDCSTERLRRLYLISTPKDDTSSNLPGNTRSHINVSTESRNETIPQQNKWSCDNGAKLRNYVTREAIFGPLDSREVSEPEAMASLFERQNKSFRELHQRPAIIIGRRGSGKTAYLRSVYFSGDYEIVLELNAADTLVRMVQAIEPLTGKNFLPEAVAAVWNAVFWIILFSALIKQRSDDKGIIPLKQYLAALGIQSSGNPDDTIAQLGVILNEKAAKKVGGALADALRRPNGITLDDARSSAQNFLVANRQRAVLLFDSIESYPLETPRLDQTLAGLLKCVGEFNKPGGIYDIRFCLPSELYSIFRTMSRAPLKDFRSTLALHWHAKELLLLAAHRLYLYLYLYDESRFRDVQSLDFTDKAQAREILNKALPNVLENEAGEMEPTFPYILRHTQLLPRHLLMYLNAMCGNSRLNGNITFPIPGRNVFQALEANQGLLCDEIFSAYYSIHPAARAGVEACVPELKWTFTDGELHKVFNRHGKKAVGHSEFHDFKRMLIEIGAVGLVLNETAKYVEARFAYTVPAKLSAPTEDVLCLHPAFGKAFGCKSSGKAIYPYGVDVDEIDWRE